MGEKRKISKIKMSIFEEKKRKRKYHRKIILPESAISGIFTYKITSTRIQRLLLKKKKLKNFSYPSSINTTKYNVATQEGRLLQHSST